MGGKMKIFDKKEKLWLMRALSECRITLDEEGFYPDNDLENNSNQEDIDYLDELENKIMRL